MKLCRPASLIIICGLVAAFAQNPVGAQGRKVEVVGTVVGVAGPPRNIATGVYRPPCNDRLLFRIARKSGPFRAGEYIVLQYDRPPYPCKLPEEMFSGQSVWKFKLSREASGQGTLLKMIPIWDMTGGKAMTADTPYGRLTVERYANLTMLDGGRIEDLPLDVVVREFKFRPKDYKMVAPMKRSSPPHGRLQPARR